MLMILEVVFIILLIIDDGIHRRKYNHMLQLGMVGILFVILYELVQYNVQKFFVHFKGTNIAAPCVMGHSLLS